MIMVEVAIVMVPMSPLFQLVMRAGSQEGDLEEYDINLPKIGFKHFGFYIFCKLETNFIFQNLQI